MKSRRQRTMRIFEATGVGLVALNAVLYFAAYRPLADRVAAAQQYYTQARSRARIQQARVERLEEFQAGLPQASAALQDFKAHRTSPGRQGFSAAVRLLRQAADSAGLQPPSVTFRLDSGNHDPLGRLGLEINTAGSYQGLVKFTHALETANDFLLTREFKLSAPDKGAVNLRLLADFYVTP